MTVAMLVIFSAMLLVTLSYPEGARFMPMVIGLPAVGLCLLQLVIDLRSRPEVSASGGDGNVFAKGESEVARITGREIHFDVTTDQPLVVETEVSEAEAQRREYITWAFFLGLIGGVILFGFWVTLPLFIFSFLVTMASMRWPKALALAVVAGVALHLVFVEGLKVPLHQGFVTEMLVNTYWKA
jgi:hypothetical protein